MDAIRGVENIFVRAQFGRHKDVRLLKCRDCGEQFSERRGTIFSARGCQKKKPSKSWNTSPQDQHGIYRAAKWHGQKSL